MTYTTFALEYAGHDSKTSSFAYDLKTRGGVYAGTIVETPKGTRVYFNSTATRGSARRFANVQAASEYMYQRRIKKGWGV